MFKGSVEVICDRSVNDNTSQWMFTLMKFISKQFQVLFIKSESNLMFSDFKTQKSVKIKT